MVAALSAAGALAGLMLAHLLIQYRAVSRLPWDGKVTDYRRAEATITSPQALRRYIKSKGAEDDDLAEYARQLERGARAPVVIEHLFPMARNDARDAREVREYINLPVIGAGAHTLGPISYIEISTYASQPEKAGRLNEAIRTYVKGTLLAFALNEMAAALASEAHVEAPRLQNRIEDLTARIANVQSLTKSMAAIRDRYKEFPSASAELATIPLSEKVQPEMLQRFLSPVRQLVGLETERIHLEEQRRQAELKLAPYAVMDTFAARVRQHLASQDPATALGNSTSDLSLFDERKSNPEQQQEMKVTKTYLNAQLAGLKDRYVERMSNLDDPVIRRLPSGAIAFAIAGLLLPLPLWFMLRRREQSA